LELSINKGHLRIFTTFYSTVDDGNGHKGIIFKAHILAYTLFSNGPMPSAV